MGGKRPDQYMITPNEGGTTDYKFNPENTHGQTKDQPQLREGDKQRLTEHQKGGQPFLPDVPSPTAAANRGEKLPEDQAASSGEQENG